MSTKAGPGNPPIRNRFRKGQSGNPRGRPRGRHNEPPYEAILGRTVTIRENGVERQVTAAEAFLPQLAKQGLEVDAAAARLAMPAIEAARAARNARGDDDPEMLTIVIRSFGSINRPLEALRMARKLDWYRDTARMALEPWIVEAALARLGNRRLTLEEQEAVVRATRTPGKVKWPGWWRAGS